MGVRWIKLRSNFSFLVGLILLLEIRGCLSLNSEGLALLEFRAVVEYDPYGALANWNACDADPCRWTGVICVDNIVQHIILSDLSLEGSLSPQLGNLSHLKSLELSNNCFYGTIPKEIGKLTMLELLDLRNNELKGPIPVELTGLKSLEKLLVYNNVFEGKMISLLSEPELDENRTICFSRRFQPCVLKELNKTDYLFISIIERFMHYLNLLTSWSGENGFTSGANNSDMVQNIQVVVGAMKRRLLQESNLAASYDSPPIQIVAIPISRSSGSFSAIPIPENIPPTPSPLPSPISDSDKKPPVSGSGQKQSDGKGWVYVGAVLAIVLLKVAGVTIIMYRSKSVTNICPWKTGLTGKLQKAFITGVPKLNRGELDAACEDFCNIIDTINGSTLYKGTLLSGVEIAVTSTAIKDLKQWSKRSQRAYRKKIDTLTRINHKNFVNLIGYCEEEHPFTRMMVFEYSPNGTLSEHLHVKEVEHLDWGARIRIIMGTAYCLQHMHDLTPPVVHPNLNANHIFLTVDYAAKIGDISFGPKTTASSSRNSMEDESEHLEQQSSADPESNMYHFGLMLLEVISGKVPYEGGSISKWAVEYLNGKQSICGAIDPTLKSFKKEELEILGKVMMICAEPDPKKRPAMKEVIAKLKEVIKVTPEQAVPRISPLWWAELEILSGSLKKEEDELP